MDITKPSGKYTEIFKLKKMLEDAGVMFDWVEHFGYPEDVLDKYPELTEHYQICYPISDSNHRWISVIEGYGTYGSTDDKLEIMGGLYPSEQAERESVLGWLTAENVFERIINHWNKTHNV